MRDAVRAAAGQGCEGARIANETPRCSRRSKLSGLENAPDRPLASRVKLGEHHQPLRVDSLGKGEDEDESAGGEVESARVSGLADGKP